MFFSSKLRRARVLTLFVLAAAAVYSALSAPTLFNQTALAANENVQVFNGDCRTPQTIFFLGDTVCVRVADLPAPATAAEHFRRITWSAPGFSVAEIEVVGADPEFDRFTIPTTGPFAVPGKWRVHSVDIETNARADGHFTVRHPRSLLVDLGVWKAGPGFVLPGDKVRYLLTVRNEGPELAQTVQFAEDVPTNATFLALRQRSGPLFECQLPKEGETGRILCTTGRMKLGEEASFDVYYAVNAEAREGDFCEGRTQVASATEELSKLDNIWRAATFIANPKVDDWGTREEEENPEGIPPGEVPKAEEENPPGMPPGPTPPPEKENPPGIPPPDDVPPPEEENP
jgi:uncharacterized repeat protein (TIGR01451 family)